MVDMLQQIQEAQFSDRSGAERMLLSFIREAFPLDVVNVELRPKAVSLNSFNGLLTLTDGTRLFFKTHTESDTVIGEYYNTEMLAEAGYPVLQPRYSSTEVGRQLLIYDLVDDPSVFDVAWSIERGDTTLLPTISRVQRAADRQLFQIYLDTMGQQSATDAARAPIHQLFHHRLVGGRLDRFLGGGGMIALPSGDYFLDDVRNARWTINSQSYDETLNDLVARAVTVLDPDQAGPSVVGHGDAHNGNLFFQGESGLVYFDAAFAGRHDPLLDLAKPLFHNVFAMWMYFPTVKQAESVITARRKGNDFHIDYDYQLPAIRKMFLRSKVDHVLIPLVHLLHKRDLLRPDWRNYLKAALFCCPLLTMNLTDTSKFPPEISLLGLVMAIEMGAESTGHSLIDQILDEVEISLHD